MPRNRNIQNHLEKNQPIETKSKMTKMIEFGDKDLKSTIVNMFSMLEDLKKK